MLRVPWLGIYDQPGNPWQFFRRWTIYLVDRDRLTGFFFRNAIAEHSAKQRRTYAGSIMFEFHASTRSFRDDRSRLPLFWGWNPSTSLHLSKSLPAQHDWTRTRLFGSASGTRPPCTSHRPPWIPSYFLPSSWQPVKLVGSAYSILAIPNSHKVSWNRDGTESFRHGGPVLIQDNPKD